MKIISISISIVYREYALNDYGLVNNIQTKHGRRVPVGNPVEFTLISLELCFFVRGQIDV